MNDEAPGAVQGTSTEKAARGRKLITEAILELLDDHPDGLRNSDIARKLALESDHQGKQKDYLTFSILGLLLRDGRVEKILRGSKTLYLRKA